MWSCLQENENSLEHACVQTCIVRAGRRRATVVWILAWNSSNAEYPQWDIGNSAEENPEPDSWSPKFQSFSDPLAFNKQASGTCTIHHYCVSSQHQAIQSHQSNIKKAFGCCLQIHLHGNSIPHWRWICALTNWRNHEKNWQCKEIVPRFYSRPTWFYISKRHKRTSKF